jgi:hemerythrin superfamily protein
MAMINDSASKRRSERPVKRAAGVDESQNAIALLKADHRQVEKLFKTFKATRSAADKQPLAKQICTALKMHMQLEEEIFYPAFVGATGDKEIHNEALVEHQSAKALIGEIESSVAGDPLFDARVNVLSEMIKHHVKEEERFKGMFLTARVAKMDLRALGALMEARKRELEAGERPAEEPEVASLMAGAARAQDLDRPFEGDRA